MKRPPASSIERKWLKSPSRRHALARLAATLGAGAALPLIARGQSDPRPLSSHVRHPGLDEMETSFDFEPLMFANVPLATYDYTAHGDGSEFTLRRNRRAFEWATLVKAARPADPKAVDLSGTLLGVPMKFPLIVAPSAFQGPLHPDGEVGMFKGATAAATHMVLSQNTSTPVDKVSAGANGTLWWQFYPQQDLDVARQVLDRAQAAGCRAVVLTVDQQASYYERTQMDRNLGGTPVRGGGAGRGRGAAPTAGPGLYRLGVNRLWYTWQYLDDLRKVIHVPLVVKGILRADDAERCVEHGVDAIIVSNHGGRSMDYGPATLEVLPEVVAAVRGRIPVITDSGYRRGTDVLKALALGARAVMLGRTARWGLGAFGAPGVQRLLEIMQRELVEAAAAAGCATLASIDAKIIETAFP